MSDSQLKERNCVEWQRGHNNIENKKSKAFYARKLDSTPFVVTSVYNC